jgi:hypothetical protein
MGKTGVPERADRSQRIIDDDVIHFSVEQFVSAVNELGNQQVLAFRRDLCESIRGRCIEPRLAHHVKHAILVLHEAPDRRKRCLVFQSAVEEGATELVPATATPIVVGTAIATM